MDQECSDSDYDIPFESFQYICRTCLRYTNLIIPINNVDQEGQKLEEILHFVPIQFQGDDRLPQNMCLTCIVKMYRISRFLKLCVNSQQLLRNVLSNYSKEQQNLQSKIIEAENYTKNTDIIETENVETDNYDNASSSAGGWNDSDSDSDWSPNEDDVKENLYEDVKDVISEEVLNKENDSKVDLGDLVNKIQVLKSEISTLKTEKTEQVLRRRRRKVIGDGRHKMPKVKRVRVSGPPFICSVCSESFDLYPNLRKHWQMANHRPKNFKCTYCPSSFKNNCLLQQHIRTHTGEKPNICDVCNKRFNHYGNFKRHMLIHEESKRYKCNECDQGFNRLEFLKDHKRKYHSEEKLLCPYCGKEFTCLGTLKMHEKQHVNVKQEITIDPTIPFQCKTCGKILASEEILNDHMQIHLKKKYSQKSKRDDKEGDCSFKERRDPTCDFCKTIFKNSYELRLHKLNSSCSKLVRRYNCSQCDKIFITYAALYAHLKLHKEETQNRLYECHICHEQFYKERRYKDHIKRHTRERKFICTECGQGFFVKLHLENHMRTHTGERPFACDICHKAFALKVNLTVHMRTHNSEKPFKCYVCSHDFRDLSSLKKHSKRYHQVDLNLDNNVV